MTTVSLLGLGAMGAPMAEQLLAAGHELTVWNRSPQRATPFIGRAIVAATPAEAAADIVVTVTTDLDGVHAVLEGPDGLLDGWQRSGITDPVLLVMGTVSPRAVTELAERLAARRVHLIDAPVSGGVVGAQAGTLSIMAGGDAASLDRAAPVLEAMGDTIRHMGPVGSGALAKLCNQLIVAAGVTAISEAMLLARRSGLDLPALADILEGGLAGSAILRQKGANWIDEEFVAGGSASNQLKDLRFAQSAMADVGLVLPLSGTVTELFENLIAAGEGDLDHTGIYREIERRAAADSANTQGES